MFADIHDKSLPRGFKWIWYIRFPQLALSILVLALAAWNASSLKSIHCDVTGKISYNIACAVLSMVVVTYLILSTGPSNMFKVLPWLVWGQLALDCLMFIFWIAAAAVSPFDDIDLFNACYNSYLNYDFSTYNPYAKRDTSLVSRAFGGALEPRKSRGSSSSYNAVTFTTGSFNARTAFDALLIILFLITLGSTAWWFYQNQRSAGSAAPTTQPPAHNNIHGGGGVPTMAPQEPTATYSQPQMQQSQYYQEKPQPAPAVYNQSTPQPQYSQPANPAY